MSLVKAYQIEVKSSTSTDRQVFFVEASSEDAAMAALAVHSSLLPDPQLNLKRRLSDAEIDMHQIDLGTIMQWI